MAQKENNRFIKLCMELERGWAKAITRTCFSVKK
jgi:hypothetical protein